MQGRVTGLDRHIAERLKEFRKAAGLTQPQVAEHLGVKYQSYQRMEAGRCSFRASTLDRLALLYDKSLSDFVSGGEAQIDQQTATAISIFSGMSYIERESSLRAILNIKHGDRS